MEVVTRERETDSTYNRGGGSDEGCISAFKTRDLVVVLQDSAADDDEDDLARDDGDNLDGAVVGSAFGDLDLVVGDLVLVLGDLVGVVGVVSVKHVGVTTSTRLRVFLAWICCFDSGFRLEVRISSNS
jgi:hypothetical protein